MDKRPSTATPVPPRVMLLSLWRRDSNWHARLVDADASVREFDSPFELARYLCLYEHQAPHPPKGGLR
ncbi:MAG: hypothetical protein ABI633_13395 [Burkholderiales bacterium]